MFFLRNDKIEVTIVDIDDGKVIARSMMKADEIPEFDPATTIHLNEIEYDVLEASPESKELCAKQKKLTLKVRRSVAQVAATEDILYTIPTIANDILPLVKEGKTGKNTFKVHEDDWRQFELISKSLSPVIESELAGIREVRQNLCTEEGFFKAIFVRKLIKTPLQGSNLRIDELQRQLKVRTVYDGISLINSAGILPGFVKDGFAFQGLNGTQVFGQAIDNVVVVANLSFASAGDTARCIDEVVKLLASHDLLCVDWLQAAVMATDIELKRALEP